MKPQKLALLGLLLLSAGCPTRIVIPDEKQPHQLAVEADVTVWCRGPETDALTKCKVRAPAGWWIVSPRIADP